jgi:hypothetical protein
MSAPHTTFARIESETIPLLRRALHGDDAAASALCEHGVLQPFAAELVRRLPPPTFDTWFLTRPARRSAGPGGER